MRELFLVGIGGFVGSACRFKVAQLTSGLSSSLGFPLSTLIVNSTGCLIAGFIVAWLARLPSASLDLRLILLTGLLGGFTTFSAFGVETVALIRSGQLTLAAVNVFASLVGGLLGVWIGTSLESKVRSLL